MLSATGVRCGLTGLVERSDWFVPPKLKAGLVFAFLFTCKKPWWLMRRVWDGCKGGMVVMMYKDKWSRYIILFLAMSTVLFLSTSCSHRAVHTTSHPGKGKTVGQSVDDSMGLEDMSMQDGQGIASGALADGMMNKDGLLEQESLLGDDDLVQELSPDSSGKNYWQEREQAAMMAAQAGLGDIFFEFDSWHLTNQAKLTLTSNAEWLKAHPDVQVTIEGHCDERGTRAYNYVLGEKRALRTRNYLASLGVSPDQLLVMTYGKDNPLCKGMGSNCYQQNRRAHLVLGVDVASTIQEEQRAEDEWNTFER